jgi:lipoprotein Spr/probable lipoprotein NlpC
MPRHLKNSVLCVFLVFLAACGSRKNTGKTYAERASDALSQVRSKKLIRFIRDWEGVPYKLGGLNKRGIDCSGFAMLLQDQIYDEKLPRRSVEQSKIIKRKYIDDLKEGDLIFFSFGGGDVDHVGIYLNRNYFVHASTQRGVIIDDLSYYQKQIVRAGSVR